MRGILTRFKIILGRLTPHCPYQKTSKSSLTDLGGGRADGTWEKRLRRYLKPD